MKDSTFKKYCLVVDEWFINGFNGVKAYLKFYPNVSPETASVEFYRILRIPKIKEYKEIKMSKAVDEMELSLSRQLLRLDYIIDTADKEADKINALKEQNKLLALYEEHNKQKNKVVEKDYSNLSDKEAKDLALLELKAVRK